MAEKGCSNNPIDPQEFEIPETVFSRDINNKVFQGVIEKALSRISGISLQNETLLDQVIGRTEKFRGITTIQDSGSQSIKVKIEILVKYGTNIPQKAEEIHSAVAEELTKITGLHVSEVHVVFKDLIVDAPLEESKLSLTPTDLMSTTIQEEFEDAY